MISTRVTIRGSAASKRAAAQILKTYSCNASGLRPTSVIAQHAQLSLAGQRSFSTSRNNSKINEFFEQKETEKVRRTPAAWEHPAYTKEQMNAVVVAHREARTWA
jgi:ubiquinol oxidase